MLATTILSIIIFGCFCYVIYNRFIKRHGADSCHNCDDIGCPLVDPAKVNRKKTQSK